MKRATRIPPLVVLLERYPDVRSWLEGGVYLTQALALGRAGIHGPADLEGVTREQFLMLPQVGPKTMLCCERIVGRPLPTERESADVSMERDARKVLSARQWRALGFGTVTAKAFETHELTLEKLKQMGRSRILSIRGVGPGALERCRALLGPDCMPEEGVE